MPVIVICDEDEDFRVYLTDLLEAAGWSVTSVARVDEALERAVETQPDVVTLHFLRSGLGPESVARFRERTNARLLVLTGLDDWGYGSGVSEIDVDGVVSKWLPADDLVAALTQPSP